MELTSLQIINLKLKMKHGGFVEATEYLQQELNMSREEATQAVEKLWPAIASTNVSHTPDSIYETTKEPETKSSIGKVFMAIGIILMGIGGYVVVLDMLFIQNAVVVNGKVVDYNWHVTANENSSTSMYSLVVEYEYNGQLYIHTNNYSTKGRSFEIGDSVELYVNPDAPDSALANSFMERWFIVTLWVGMGAVMVGAGYITHRVF